MDHDAEGGAGAGGAPAGGNSGGAGAAGAGSDVDAADGGSPTIFEEFGSGTTWYERSQPQGSAAFGVPNARAADSAVAELMFPGNPALGPADNAGPGFATEIGTNDRLSYGTYRARVQLGTCQPGEELVNGIFTYFNDGADHDGDGVPDNSEIDIEVLCSDPAKLSLTIWTEYDDKGGAVSTTRRVDVDTGDYYETPLGGGDLAKAGHSDAFKHPGFPDPQAFYEMGFEWHAASLRYFIVLDGAEITLWDFHETKYIPHLDASFLFNIWHAQTNWWTGSDADYPASAATLRVDWFKYWKE
jgi:hypothetical protein